MPKKLSYRIDLYDLIFYNTTKQYRKDVATYMLRIYNKLGNKGRYIEQYELPFRDIDGIITYIHDKHPYIMDNKDTLLAKLFDQIKFEYYCVLSAIKTRKMLCNDMTDIETSFTELVDPSIKEFSHNEVVIAKKILTDIDVDILVNKYHAKYDNEDISDEEDDEDYDDDVDDNKCITYQQIEIDLGKHRDNGKGQPKSVEDVVRRQCNIEKKLVSKPLKDNQLTCDCGIVYTKQNLSRHRKSPMHVAWESNNGGKESL
jgi:hypothetical protein